MSLRLLPPGWPAWSKQYGGKIDKGRELAIIIDIVTLGRAGPPVLILDEVASSIAIRTKALIEKENYNEV